MKHPEKTTFFSFALCLLLFFVPHMHAMEQKENPQQAAVSMLIGGLPQEFFPTYQCWAKLLYPKSTLEEIIRQKDFGSHFQIATKSKAFYSYLLDYKNIRDHQHILNAFAHEKDTLLPNLKIDASKAKKTEHEIVKQYMTHHIVARIAPDIISDSGEPTKTKVLYDNNDFVGFATYFRQNLESGHLQFLYVEKNLRRKGFGKKLVSTAVDDLFNTGSINRIWLSLNAKNTAALDFYTKLGFKKCDDKKGTSTKECVSLEIMKHDARHIK